jgi:hypothetical protein
VVLNDRNPLNLMDAGVCFCLGFSPGLDWPPDGTRLALVISGDNLGQPDGLYTVDADGAGLTLLERHFSGAPAWRPAG